MLFPSNIFYWEKGGDTSVIRPETTQQPVKHDFLRVFYVFYKRVLPGVLDYHKHVCSLISIAHLNFFFIFMRSQQNAKLRKHSIDNHTMILQNVDIFNIITIKFIFNHFRYNVNHTVCPIS